MVKISFYVCTRTYVHECARVLHYAQLDRLIGVTHFDVIIGTLIRSLY